MFAAISGLRAHQIMLDTTANDLANVNTLGYKSARTTFRDSLSQIQRGGSGTSGTQGGTNAAQVGLGVQLGSIDNLMGTGAIQSTGNVLDVAIQGQGWFRVGTGTPPAVPTSFQYSRAGNFTTNDVGYLVTADGYYVVGRSAAGAGGTDQYLQIPPGSTSVAIAQDGGVSYIPTGGGARVTAGYLSLALFPNEAGLERASGNRWIAGPNSGAEVVATPGGAYGLTTSGAIEMSNVDLAQSFTNMITAQRGFQANSRVISTADEMLQDLVNLKR
ncbi:MAG: flagellar hook-basal body complex protein [Solirubrobacteraceae bacterium]